MSYLRYEQEIDYRAVDRTPYRYSPASCLSCGYHTKPSLSMSSCSGCNVFNKNKNGNKK